MLIDKASLNPDSAEFVKNRVLMQDEHMQTIWQKFDGSVRAVVPLYESEVRGPQMLSKMAGDVFGA